MLFYIDEYVKDAPKDLLAVLGESAEWLEKSLKKTKPEYEAYARRTNAFFPWRPKA